MTPKNQVLEQAVIQLAQDYLTELYRGGTASYLKDQTEGCVALFTQHCPEKRQFAYALAVWKPAEEPPTNIISGQSNGSNYLDKGLSALIEGAVSQDVGVIHTPGEFQTIIRSIASIINKEIDAKRSRKIK